MKVTSNKDMLNAIRNQASEEYKEKVGLVSDDMQARAVKTVLDSYPTIKNEFINTLVNKVVRTDFFSRVYENPLKMLKKGTLAYGTSIEELFVMAAEAKGFLTNGFNDDTAATPAQQADTEALVAKENAKVKTLYITRNFAEVYKTSISDAQLKGAFFSQNGLSELVNQLVGSLTNGAEQDEYKHMIKLINAAAQCKQIKAAVTGKIEEADEQISSKIADNDGAIRAANSMTVGVTRPMRILKVDAVTPNGLNKGQAISKAVRAMAGRMKFVSDKYNMAGVPTFCNPEDLVFLTTPEIMAELDVTVLAQAFNVSNADVNVRTILVDELPKKFEKGKFSNTETKAKDNIRYTQGANLSADLGDKVYGILMDKNFLQVIDTVNETRTFDNGRTLSQNLFLHRQGILANCYFSNCVALVASDAAVDPTGI